MSTLSQTSLPPCAFPNSGFGCWAPEAGATLFELYAGMAMHGLICGQYRDNATGNITELTREAFGIAGAMMMQRIGVTEPEASDAAIKE